MDVRKDYPKMMEILYTLGRIVATSNVSTMATDEIIAVAEIFPEWAKGQHAAGSVVKHAGQPWRCLQAHDSTGNPTWCPGSAASLWVPYHGTTVETALPWVAPTGAHDAYNSGEYMIWTDGAVYLCGADATVHAPDVLPGAWTLAVAAPEPVSEPTPKEDTEINTEEG